MSSSPAFPSLEQLRVAARFGILMASITFVAVELASFVARSSSAGR